MEVSAYAEFYVTVTQEEYELIKAKISDQFHEIERVGDKILLTMVERGSVEKIRDWLVKMNTAASFLKDDLETARKTLGKDLFNQKFQVDDS